MTHRQTENAVIGHYMNTTPYIGIATIGGQELSIRCRELAQQANGSVVVRYGDTVVLGTATRVKPRFPDADFMPLLVEYEEKFYAAGKIKGSRFIKREGKPNDDAIATARLIDRAIRPLFPEDMIDDVQVVLTVLSYDGANNPDVLGLIAACAALTISDISWQGSLAAVRVNLVGDSFVVNPTVAQKEGSTLDMVVAGTADTVVMMDISANQVSEEHLLDAITVAQKELATITAMLNDLQRAVGKQKQEPTRMMRNDQLNKRIQDLARPVFVEKLAPSRTKDEIAQAERDTVAVVMSQLTPEEAAAYPEKDIRRAIHELHGSYQRERILTDSWRADGRMLDEIRSLSIQVGILPRTHGSALFKRGQTQILSVTTLGGPGDILLLDTMEIEAKKRYIHHYNFPGYSVGEVRPNRGPGRREIGHGALAERALIPVLPDERSWPPYTILVVSEVLESHGSSSMAAACGSSLALADAGVPITAPVAGIAIGLMTDGKGKFRILTDIAGIEDEQGDMDLKVAGTKNGITALQMDIKLAGVTHEILAQALAQGKAARLQILKEMQTVIAAPRPQLSPYAPRIDTVHIPVDRIGDLIGPRGKHINAIVEETGVEIDINDDGTVSITSPNASALEKAKERIKNLTREIKVGERFEGKVTRIMDFGAFVELLPGTEGLIHISQFRDAHVSDIHDVVKMGDSIPVVVTDIDHLGRINLSHKVAMGGTETPATPRERKPHSHPHRHTPHRRTDRPHRGPRSRHTEK